MWNATLTAFRRMHVHGYLFEKGKPVPVTDDVKAQLEERGGFQFEEVADSPVDEHTGLPLKQVGVTTAQRKANELEAAQAPAESDPSKPRKGKLVIKHGVKQNEGQKVGDTQAGVEAGIAAKIAENAPSSAEKGDMTGTDLRASSQDRPKTSTEPQTPNDKPRTLDGLSPEVAAVAGDSEKVEEAQKLEVQQGDAGSIPTAAVVGTGEDANGDGPKASDKGAKIIEADGASMVGKDKDEVDATAKSPVKGGKVVKPSDDDASKDGAIGV